MNLSKRGGDKRLIENRYADIPLRIYQKKCSLLSNDNGTSPELYSQS